MSRRGRLVTIVIVLALVLVALEAIVEALEFERHRGLVELRLSEAVGLDVRLRGDFHVELVPQPRFSVTDVHVANLPGRPSPALLELGYLDLEFDLWRLIRGVLEIDTLEVVDAEVRIETDAEGRFELPHRLETLAGDEPERDAVEFEIRSLRFENLRIFHRKGETGEVMAARFEILTLEADDFGEPISLVARGEVDGSPLELRGEFGPLPELLEPTAPYPVSLRGRILEAELDVEGTLEAPTELRGIDVAVSARLSDLNAILPESDRKLPRIGPVTAAARLTDPEGTLGVSELELATPDAAPVRVALTGSVGDLRGVRGVDLALRLEASDGRLLEPFVERPLPEISSVTASADLSDRDGSLGVEGELHVAARGDQLAIDVTGAHDDLRQMDEIDVDFGLRARDLTLIGELLALEWELPSVGPLTASGTIRDHEGAVGVRDVRVDLGHRGETWAEVRGSVRDLRRFEGVHLEAEFGAADLRHARPYLRGDPPDVGTITGTGALTDLDGKLGVERFTLRGGRKGLFEIDLAGELDHLRGIEEIEFKAKLRARDLEVLGDFFGAELAPVGPVEFAGEMTGADERLESSGTARLDETRLSGQWQASFAPGARPSLRARLHTPHLDLQDLGIAPRSRTAVATGPPGPLRDAVQARSGSGSLPFEHLRALDADVVLHADRVSGRAGLEGTDLHASIRLDDGELSIRELGVGYEGGTLDAEIRVDGRTPEPLLALRVDATGVDLTRLAAQIEEDPKTAGLLDASVNLESRGSSVQQLRSNLGGYMRGTLRDGTLASQYARAFVMQVARVSIPGWPSPGAERVSCLVTDLEIEEGVATVQRLRLEGDRASVTGEGTVDFGRDEYHLTLTPRPRNPGLLSVALAVRVSGPLAEPRFTPMPRRIATSFVRGVVDNALRPSRPLLRPFRSADDDVADPCARPPRE